MIFTIGDEQVKGGHFPLFAYGFIALNIIAWFLQNQTPDLAICEYGSIPADILRGENYHTLITSMFMHGSWMHIIGNMLFLWVFADNIEATVGSFKFLIFYIGGGIAASVVHIYLGAGTEQIGCCFPCGNEMGIRCAENAVNMCSGSIPTVGASGAISAVLGAYLVMFPKSQVKILVLVFFRSFQVAAYLFLGLWIGMQLFSGFSSIGQAAAGGTAWWAHIGGFVFGVAAGFLFREKGGIFFKEDKASSSPKPPKRGPFGKDDFV
ncbi:MAG: rhomboid family intramembrane serine protease [Bacteroidota bacterium]